ncbi:MAG: site-specific DNA-methyltransferase [Chloroflexi bacterium]|nr:MAG: site-specific DNA-methyltransferase [Chloroflexota bacterium]
MPKLLWIGKEAVLNHHNEVPFHLLRCNPDLSVGQPDSGNLLVEGDNLLALKALLPYYAGQVKCIYIDPPYNTGNENWVYNDNVNSPEIRAWLGQVVGKEVEDLSRHDKWLCMMYPRLVLLRQFLREDGAIFISIDDNEVSSLRLIMDEIFGPDNFVATVIWQKMDSPKNTAIHLSEDHDYIVIYGKKADSWRPNKLPRTDQMIARYKNPDKDPRGPWLLSDLAARNFYAQGRYPITLPSGRVIEGPPAGSYWRVSKERFDELEQDNRIWWGQSGDNRPGIKRFLSEVQEGVVPQTLWFWKDVGSTRNAKQEFSRVIGASASQDLFTTPKPTRLIQRILQIATGPNDIVLDSFAGTGTTAQAVLEQNQQDSGNRRFILVEMESDIARSVTHQRLKRVIEGYPHTGTERTELFREKLTVTNFKKSSQILTRMDEIKAEHKADYNGFETKIEREHIMLYGKKKIEGFKEGLGGGFRYCQLGPTLFDANGQLRQNEVSFTDLARHVFFTETGSPLPADVQGNSPLIGVYGNTAIYLLYNGIISDIQPDGGNVLTRSVLASLPPHNGPKIIYGNGCLLSRDYLQQHNIAFRQTPYEIKVA